MLVVGCADCKPAIKKVVEQLKTMKSGQMPASHIDYRIDAFVNSKKPLARLVTDENDGKIRNVSILNVFSEIPFVRGIRAVIGNKTGNISIDRKPFYMFVQDAANKVVDVMNKLVAGKYEVKAEAKANKYRKSIEVLPLYKNL